MSKRAKSMKVKNRAIPNKSHTISACMMVKSEEELLPRCLESIRVLVDEIIVVDTGSTDRTIEIAKSYGAQVYHHPWEDDFSKHRNQSIGYASGDWIFIVDADEEVVQWDRKLDTILQNKNVDSVYVKVENIYGKGEGAAWHNSIRLFRNEKSIHYTGRVHNQLTGYRNAVHSKTVISHRGYCLDQVKEEEKYLRTKALLEREIEEDQDNPKFHHYLAVAYLGRHLYDKALEEAKRTLELAHSQSSDDVLYLWTRFVGAICCINTNRLGEAESLCVAAIQNNPMHLDSFYLLCSLFYQRGNVECFLDHSDRYLSLLNRLKRNPGEFGLMVHNTIQHEWRIRLHRGFAFTEQGERDKARREYALALTKCHDKSEYYKQRCQFCLRRSELIPARKYLFKALRFDPHAKEFQTLRQELSQRFEVKGEGGKRKRKYALTQRKTNGPTISVCMIVKDEEKFLPRCLDSVKYYVDEIVIVDTGSTDSTVQIAESYGAKIYHHLWEGDFSKHRNQSINYATTDWILILDADEFLVPECGELVREAIRNETIDSVYAVVKSAFDKGRGEALHNSIRIFKNNGIIHYEGRVHNRVVGEKESTVYPITIMHEGYNLSQEQSRKKFVRTTDLLKREIEENPQHPRAYHYLAASYLSENMYDDAMEAAMKAISLAEEKGYDDFIYLWSHFIVGISYLKTNKADEAEEICLKALHKNPKHLDSHYLLAVIYFDKGNWEKSLQHSAEYFALRERIQEAPGEFGPMVHNTVNHQWRIHLHRGFAFTESGNEGKANEAFSRALDLCDDKGEYYRLLAIFRLRRSEFSRAEEYLFEALKYSPEDAELYRSGAQIYQKLGNSGKEQGFLLEVLQRNPDDTETAFRLGILYLEEGCHSKAADLFRNVITRNPNHPGALINLAVCAKRLGDLDGATRYLETALKETPDSIDALSNLGYVYYHKGDLLNAQNLFERLITADPTILDVHLVLAMIYLRINKPELVVAECDSVMSLLGLDRNITLNTLADLSNLFAGIGDVLLKQKRQALASLAFDVSIHLQTEQTQILKKIGKICLQNGSYNTGLKYLERAISLNPQDWESLQVMGECYTKIGAQEAAALCHQKAREAESLIGPR
jgi:tetratricopeptide (TPR) repeat protein